MITVKMQHEPILNVIGVTIKDHFYDFYQGLGSCHDNAYKVSQLVKLTMLKDINKMCDRLKEPNKE